MKSKKLDHQKLSANLGSRIRGRVTAKAGFFGALQLAESVTRSFTRRRAVAGPEIGAALQVGALLIERDLEPWSDGDLAQAAASVVSRRPA